MTRQETLRLLEKTLSLKAHSLTGMEKLIQVEGWDSLSAMGFIGMAYKHFGLPLSGNRVIGCQTVDELLGLLGAAVTDRAA